MCTPSKTVTLAAGAFVIANVWGPGRIGLVVAQEVPTPTKSARAGSLIKTGRYQFQVFFYPTGVRIFPRDKAHIPIDASHLSGTVTFYHPRSPRPWFERPLHTAPAGAGQPSPSLDLMIGLTTVPPMGARVTFQIKGLPDPAESMVTFTIPFKLKNEPPEAPVAHPTPPQGGVAPNPRYVYGPGDFGFGYYRYSGPETAPPHRSGPAFPLSGYGQVLSANPSSPLPYLSGCHAVSILPSASGSDAAVGPGHRDWRTGRDVPLAKPWLRPRD